MNGWSYLEDNSISFFKMHDDGLSTLGGNFK